MALISAAVAAVATAATTIGAAAAGAATVGAAVAATATAVSAVGTLVGVVGTTMTIVGAVTKNKGLAKIGGLMAMGGAAAGVAGWAVGGIAQAGGIGNWLNSGVSNVKGAVSPATKSSADAGGLAQGGLAAKPAVAPVATGSAPVAAPAAGTAAGGLSPAALTTQPITAPAASGVGAGGLSPTALTTPVAGASAPTALTAPIAPAAASAPIAPAAGMLTTPVANPGQAGGWKQWWNDLPASSKAHLALAGGQAVAGAMGGLFESMSASERLELDQLINQQRENQVQLTNQRGAYAPTVSFNR